MYLCRSIRKAQHRATRVVTIRANHDSGWDRLRIPQPSKSSQLGPSFWLTPEQGVELQLKSLQHNNFPYPDHGVEILYRFANFDPFSRSTFFGKPLDLGQFERFRRVLYTKTYETLLNHTEHKILSCLEISEDIWKARVFVSNSYRKEEVVYEFTMKRRFGGWRDGVFFTEALLADSADQVPLYGMHSDA